MYLQVPLHLRHSCWKAFLKVNWAIAKASELLHWHLQKPLVHPLAIHSYDTSCLFRMSRTLPGYLDQTHRGRFFWASKKPSPSNTRKHCFLVKHLHHTPPPTKAGRHRVRLAPWPSRSHCVSKGGWNKVVRRALWADTPKWRWLRPRPSAGSLLPGPGVWEHSRHSCWLCSKKNPVNILQGISHPSQAEYDLHVYDLLLSL